MAHFYDFATTAFGLYVLASPETAFRAPLTAKAIQRSQVALLVYVGISMMAWSGFAPLQIAGVSWHLLRVGAWAAALLPLVLPLVRHSLLPGQHPDSASVPCRQWAFMWLPILVAMNGLTVYLGVRTVTNYTMFSNLKVEGGGTNHFLPMRLLLVSRDVDDVVDVLTFEYPA